MWNTIKERCSEFFAPEAKVEEKNEVKYAKFMGHDIVNCTPHNVKICSDTTGTTTIADIPKSEFCARLAQGPQQRIDSLPINGREVPVFNT
ncbi:MAG: hypothetical protein KDK78_12145, partial [Chlamydiia bacterium]|nr:hypothetical protein [Chlamydiia bacterium]